MSETDDQPNESAWNEEVVEGQLDEIEEEQAEEDEAGDGTADDE